MTAYIFCSGLRTEIDGVTLSINGAKIQSILRQTNPMTSTVYYTFTTVNGADYSGYASTYEWDAFEDWMSRYSVQLAPEPERNPALDLAGDYIVAGPEGLIPVPEQFRAKKNKPGCPECWDTGFRHGFGAPCSRGCRP